MAKDIAVLEDVSGKDPNAEFDAVGGRDARVPIRHADLDLARATQRASTVLANSARRSRR